MGLYYSLIDWYHEDFPHYGDRQHPMRNRPDCTNEHRNFDRYLDYMHAQVRELCSNYGKIDIMWFDFRMMTCAASAGVQASLWTWCARSSPASS